MAEVQKIQVKNIDVGARGIYAANGQLVMIEPGERAEVETTEREFRDALATGYFEFGEGGAAEPGPLDAGVEALTAHIAGIDDVDEIQALIAAETAGKSRKGALAALEARRDELLA